MSNKVGRITQLSNSVFPPPGSKDDLIKDLRSALAESERKYDELKKMSDELDDELNGLPTCCHCGHEGDFWFDRTFEEVTTSMCYRCEECGKPVSGDQATSLWQRKLAKLEAAVEWFAKHSGEFCPGSCKDDPPALMWFFPLGTYNVKSAPLTDSPAISLLAAYTEAHPDG